MLPLFCSMLALLSVEASSGLPHRGEVQALPTAGPVVLHAVERDTLPAASRPARGGVRPGDAPDFAGRGRVNVRDRSVPAGRRIKEETYDLASVAERPELLNRDELVALLRENYPPELSDAGIGGDVMVKFRVTRNGLVDPTSVEVMQSSRPEFAVASKPVVARMRFKPARLGSRPVAVWVILPLTFAVPTG